MKNIDLQDQIVQIYGKDSFQYVECVAYEVGEITRELANIHNELFKFSLRKVIPIPGIFKAPAYDSLVQRLNMLTSRLIHKEEELPSPSANILVELNVLEVFIEALKHTIGSLSKLCSNLHLKSKGEKGYSTDEYNRDLEVYHNFDNARMITGASMNKIFNTAKQ